MKKATKAMFINLERFFMEYNITQAWQEETVSCKGS